MRLKLIPLLLSLGLPAGAWAAAFQTESFRPAGAKRPLEVVAGRVLVKYRKGLSVSELSSSKQRVNAPSSVDLPGLGWTVLQLPPGLPVQSALAQLQSDPAVEAAAPDRVYKPLLVPSDPAYPQQYGLSIIDAPAAWEFDVGDSTLVTVAVIDTGVDHAHPDIALKLSTLTASGLHEKFDDVSGTPSADNPPIDFCGHGTSVAGVAAAVSNNSLDISGVSWGAQVLSLRVFTSGCDSTSDTTIAAAVNYATTLYTSTPAAVGRMVINMSLGAPQSGGGGCGPSPLETAVTNALAAGIPIAAAAGNDPSQGVLCPAAISGVLAVAATDSHDNAASFSAFGPEVFISAPGVSVVSLQRTADGGGITTVDGTSFSSPHVAGVVALMLSASSSLMTPAQISTNLSQTADHLGSAGRNPNFGYGRVNAYKALRLIKRGTLSDFEGNQKVVAFPNPAQFSRGTVTFVLPPSLQGSNLSIKLYTMSGELVRSLSGNTWDGKNDGGSMVASGTYIYLVKTDSGSSRGRIAVLH